MVHATEELDLPGPPFNFTARIVLGVYNTVAVIWFSQLAHELPHIRSQSLSVQVFFLLLQALQFNFTFWATRTTHNSMVLGNGESASFGFHSRR